MKLLGDWDGHPWWSIVFWHLVFVLLAWGLLGYMGVPVWGLP